MAYNKTTWENGVTRVNATNMNHIEQGIYDNSTDGSTTDAKIGNRTINQATDITFSNTGKLTQIFSWFAKMIKSITGKMNWYDAPSKTLEDLNEHITNHPDTYELPIASSTVLGGFKVGANLTIDENGILSAQAGGGGGDLFTSPTDPIAYTATAQTTIIPIPTLTNNHYVTLNMENLTPVKGVNYEVDYVNKRVNLLNGFTLEIGNVIYYTLWKNADAIVPVIVDNLTSTDIDKGLSAKQGNVLNQQLSILKGKVADVEDFGAHSIYEVGYENYDSIQAFKDAIAYLVAKKGGTLYVPNKYILSEQLTIANMDIAIVGQSPQLSQLFFNGTNGIVYSSNNQFTDSIQITDISIVTVADNIGNGIDITFPNNSGSPWENVYINNICVSSSTKVIDYNSMGNYSQSTINNWVVAININNCAVSKILNSIVRNPSGKGICLNGSTTDMTIKDVNLYGCSICIVKEGEGEGLWIENCKGINVNSFIYINSASVAQDGVYLVIKNCHSAYYLSAIVVKRMPQIEIDGCLLYKYGDVGGGADILIENSDIAHIHHNKLLVSSGTGKNNGITINGACNFIEIDNNFINERQIGIWVVSGTLGYVQIGKNNIFGGANNTKISDSGNNTIIDYAIQPSCKVRNNAIQSIPNTAWTSLNFNTELFDTDTMHDNVTNNSRIVCKSKGVYIITGSVAFSTNATGYRSLRFLVNGVTNIGQSNSVIPSASGTDISFTHTYNLNVGDYVELQAYQTSGGSLDTVFASPFTPTFSVVRVG